MQTLAGTRAIAAMIASLLASCGGSSAPAAAPPVPDAPAPISEIVVAAPPAAPANAPLAIAKSDLPASTEFDVDALSAVPRERQTQTPAVSEVAPPVALGKRWVARIGRTTFRTTMALTGGAIVVGTHGRTLEGKNEADDGLYVLDAATGKKRAFARTPGKGDLDVGGIAIDGERVFFGADNGQVVAMSLAGKVLWKATASGKVRPAPALADLDGDGTVDVVVGDEDGVLRAIDGDDGAPLWRVGTGENDNKARGFLGAAAVADFDGDGKPDVVAGARDGILTAYRGSNGDVLWQHSEGSGIHASPSVADFDGDGHPEILAAWSYGDVLILDAKTGNARWSQSLSQDSGGIEGLFGSPIPVSGAPGVLVQGTAWWGDDDGIVGVGPGERVFRAYEGRVSSTAVVADLDGDGVREAVIGTEKGALLSIRSDGGRALLAKLGGPIEAPAMLADVDGDGTLELLVASNDGKLTCFSTESRAVADVARFRGNDLHNTGVLGSVRLGWRVAAPAAQATGGKVRIDYLTCCSALQNAGARAPSPVNADLLRSAALCAVLAADGAPRDVALAQIGQALAGKATLPGECR